MGNLSAGIQFGITVRASEVFVGMKNTGDHNQKTKRPGDPAEGSALKENGGQHNGPTDEQQVLANDQMVMECFLFFFHGVSSNFFPQSGQHLGRKRHPAILLPQWGHRMAVSR